MPIFSHEPLVWHNLDIRFTVNRVNGMPLLDLLGPHTDAQTILAIATIDKMMAEHEFIPLTEAGFQWMAVAIRLAFSEAKAAELEAEAATKTRERHEAMGARQRAEARVEKLESDRAITCAQMSGWSPRDIDLAKTTRHGMGDKSKWEAIVDGWDPMLPFPRQHGEGES